MNNPLMIPMVTLTPRGWVPDERYTGGNIPPQALMISYDYWKGLGEPASIEAYYEKLAALPKINTVDYRGFRSAQV